MVIMALRRKIWGENRTFIVEKCAPGGDKLLLPLTTIQYWSIPVCSGAQSAQSRNINSAELG